MEERQSGSDVYGMTYVLGHDVISQAAYDVVSSTTTVYQSEYLLYDGHGSVRDLVDSDNQVLLDESYHYMAYGELNTAISDSPSTNLLYTGEYYDNTAEHYYLRARWYNPANGRFNRLDPFAGNMHDPQSLHKYLYAHANPINGSDPSGMLSITEQNVVSAINNIITKASKIHRILTKARNAMDKIELITDILGLLRGDLSSIIDDIKSKVKLSDFGKYSNRFTTNGIKKGLDTLVDNGGRIITGLLKSPEKIKKIGKEMAGPNPHFSPSGRTGDFFDLKPVHLSAASSAGGPDGLAGIDRHRKTVLLR